MSKEKLECNKMAFFYNNNEGAKERADVILKMMGMKDPADLPTLEACCLAMTNNCLDTFTKAMMELSEYFHSELKNNEEFRELYYLNFGG